MIKLNSSITKALLVYFFMNEDDSVYVNELAEKLQLDKRNMVKKLQELEEEGLFASVIQGNQKYYSLNLAYPLYDEYKSIFLKTAGLEYHLKKAVAKVKGINRAFIFGSYANNSWGTDSDIDLAVIGDHSIIELQKELNEIQKNTSREINVIHLSEDELEKRTKTDPFIKTILDGPIIELV